MPNGQKFEKNSPKLSVRRYEKEKNDRFNSNRLCLGFEGDVTLLDDKIHLHRLPDRYTLVKEGEHLNKLFFIIRGSIVNYMKEISGSKRERSS